MWRYTNSTVLVKMSLGFLNRKVTVSLNFFTFISNKDELQSPLREGRGTWEPQGHFSPTGTMNSPGSLLFDALSGAEQACRRSRRALHKVGVLQPLHGRVQHSRHGGLREESGRLAGARPVLQLPACPEPHLSGARLYADFIEDGEVDCCCSVW